MIYIHEISLRVVGNRLRFFGKEYSVQDFINEATDEIIQTLEGLGFSDYALKINGTQKVVIVKTSNFKGEKHTKQMM